MKKYSVTQVRERLAEALDRADAGVPVVIERRGSLYRLTAERPVRRTRARTSRIDVLDPAVEAGTWTWASTPDGLAFDPLS